MRIQIKGVSWLFLTGLALAVPSGQALARDPCPAEKIGCFKVLPDFDRTIKELGLDDSTKSQPKIDWDIDNPFETKKQTQRRQQSDW